MSPDWHPTATFEILRRRARILAEIRAFFASRGVLEVETPTLSHGTVTDLHLVSLETRCESAGERRTLYLQTSPEFAMKRLLAAGSGPIFQLARAFRDGERGSWHNPEFTLLEWYRPGFDHHALMDDLDEFLQAVLASQKAERLSYGELFQRGLNLDAHRAEAAELEAAARRVGLEPPEGLERDALLDFLMSLHLEQKLGRGRPTFLYDYPASQAALAKVRAGDPPVAERFEVYLEGMELANGFHELTDGAEQRRRFLADLEKRRQRGLPKVAIDERFLAALEASLPPCSGVALGVDRLVMMAVGARAISEVVAFPTERA